MSALFYVVMLTKVKYIPVHTFNVYTFAMHLLGIEVIDPRNYLKFYKMLNFYVHVLAHYTIHIKFIFGKGYSIKKTGGGGNGLFVRGGRGVEGITENPCFCPGG